MRYSTLATLVALLSSVAATDLSLDSRGSDSSVVWAPSYSSDDSNSDYSKSDYNSDDSNSDSSYSSDSSWSKGSDSGDYSSKSVDSYKSGDSTKTQDSYSHASKTGESYTKVTHISKAYGDKNSTHTKTKTGTNEVWYTHSVYKTKSWSGSSGSDTTIHISFSTETYGGVTGTSTVQVIVTETANAGTTLASTLATTASLVTSTTTRTNGTSPAQQTSSSTAPITFTGAATRSPINLLSSLAVAGTLSLVALL